MHPARTLTPQAEGRKAEELGGNGISRLSRIPLHPPSSPFIPLRRHSVLTMRLRLLLAIAMAALVDEGFVEGHENRLPRCPEKISKKRSIDCERSQDCRLGETCCSYGYGTYCAYLDQDYDYDNYGVTCGRHGCRRREKCVHAETEGCFGARSCRARDVCVPRGVATCETVRCTRNRECVNEVNNGCGYGKYCEVRVRCIRRDSHHHHPQDRSIQYGRNGKAMTITEHGVDGACGQESKCHTYYQLDW
ncbi:unnamed protein product [Darwinula stevensoni]|uniref:WAP domain-containing protein n=1 Tax=Darwinula stevensoni TaxID=69355 RepID=A0A7R9A9Q4_9CRUS|nr:unnamed protein product [Darwinula stevensoni]CAG0897581.1 unnamed protein product [Darwinula stevensoni]